MQEFEEASLRCVIGTLATTSHQITSISQDLGFIPSLTGNVYDDHDTYPDDDHDTYDDHDDTDGGIDHDNHIEKDDGHHPKSPHIERSWFPPFFNSQLFGIASACCRWNCTALLASGLLVPICPKVFHMC